MSVNLYGYETGVLLSKDDPEFDHYAHCNPSLPYGFYNEDFGFCGEAQVESLRASLREYVQEAVEGTYAIVSRQGTCSENEIKDLCVEPASDSVDYSFFRDKDEVIYSVCKQNGVLIEGFLEDLLDAQRTNNDPSKTAQGQEDNMVSYGRIRTSFFAVQRHNAATPMFPPYYSLDIIDALPQDFSRGTVDAFMRDNQDVGHSVSGSWPQVMRELHGHLPRRRYIGPERVLPVYAAPDLIPTAEKDLSIPPLCSVRDLSETVTAIANRAFEIATEETSTGQYYVGYDDVSDLINESDYNKYFDLIVDEIYSNEALLDLEITTNNELDMVCGLAWCKNYVPIDGDQYTEPGVDFGYEDLHPLPSLAHLADIGALTISHFVEKGTLSKVSLPDLGVTDDDICYFKNQLDDDAGAGRTPTFEQVIADANEKSRASTNPSPDRTGPER